MLSCKQKMSLLKNVNLESGVIGKTIVDHGTSTSVVLTLSDLNKIHVFRNISACIVTLPNIDSANLGDWLRFLKRAAGNLTINRGGSDTLLGSYTSVVNNIASETYVFLEIEVDTNNNWGLGPLYGNWNWS